MVAFLRKNRFGIAWVLGLVAVLLLSGTARAQSGSTIAVTDDQVNEVASELYCPVCENTPLDVCPTQACAQWRDLIRLKLSEGWTKEQIKDYFAEQYGIRVLGTPPATGLTFLLYALPYLGHSGWRGGPLPGLQSPRPASERSPTGCPCR